MTEIVCKVIYIWRDRDIERKNGLERDRKSDNESVNDTEKPIKFIRIICE